jgi:hypothetical protein
MRRKARNASDPQRVALFTTWAYDPIARKAHRHVAVFGSEFGNGQTDVINGHSHRVHHLDVRESAEHTHELTEVRALRQRP